LLDKFFNWLSHFLRICILLVPNNTHILKNVIFCIWVFKICRISCWFQIRGSNWKKVHPEKVICQKHLQVTGKKEDKLQFSTPSCLYFFVIRFARNGTKFWKHVLQKFLIITFYTYILVKPNHFLKNIIIAVPYYTIPPLESRRSVQ